jgi:murein DD-endopeptidase MepM/ murein hydrolase activator NlpD
MKKTVFALLIIGVMLFAGLAYFYFFAQGNTANRSAKVSAYLRNPEKYAGWAVGAGSICGDAPFQMPTSGFIGFLWDDSFRPGHRHQGLDIFGGAEPGITPIYAAYDGYLSRLPEWKSTVIIRIPSDPLNPGTQIWTYYTHMADKNGISSIAAQFPPNTIDVFVPAGTLLGYQGNFSGTAGNPTGVHLHFSIVKDDGNGKFMNELEIKNTIDPSPYFGLALNANENPDPIAVCEK